MNAIKLTLVTMCMMLITTSTGSHANIEYELQCTSSEVGIRWPSYMSNSQYYVCQREGGKVMIVSCDPGEVFTFVLQACTPYSKYIPAPPMNALPTSSTPVTGGKKPDQYQPPSATLPKPYYPENNVKPPQQPPVFPPLSGIAQFPPSPPLAGVPQQLPSGPPAVNGEIPTPPILSGSAFPGLNGLLSNMPITNHLPVNNNSNVKPEDLPPMPATAGPTPPVVADTADNKKPVSSSESKPSGSKASTAKQTAGEAKTAAADKKAVQSANKKTTKNNDEKKSSKSKNKGKLNASKLNAPSVGNKATKDGKNTKLEKNSKTKKNTLKNSPKSTNKATKDNKASPSTAKKVNAKKPPKSS